MIFTTKAFLVFLPLVLVGYHALSGRAWKYRFLLAASWGFYALCSPRYLWVILAPDGRRLSRGAEESKTHPIPGGRNGGWS